MMKEYKVLFLDLDNTLLDFAKAESSAIKKVLTAFSLPNDDVAVKTYSAINDSYWKRFEKGEIPKSAIFEGRFHTFLDLYNLKSDIPAISKAYFEALSETYFVVDGAVEILKYLKQKGYYLCATTNGVALTQYNRIKHSGLEPFFDSVFVSETIGFQKPQAEYFQYVISHIEYCEKADILIVGDSQSSDILGGINSGIDTCWYNPNHQTPTYNSKFEIHSLLDLKNIL